jgi:hypothetical protein
MQFQHMESSTQTTIIAQKLARLSCDTYMRKCVTNESLRFQIQPRNCFLGPFKPFKAFTSHSNGLASLRKLLGFVYFSCRSLGVMNSSCFNMTLHFYHYLLSSISTERIVESYLSLLIIRTMFSNNSDTRHWFK